MTESESVNEWESESIQYNTIRRKLADSIFVEDAGHLFVLYFGEKL